MNKGVSFHCKSEYVGNANGASHAFDAHLGQIGVVAILESDRESGQQRRPDQFEHWLNLESDTTYVVNFWATWCKPCVAELPYFETLTEQYSDQKVKVVLVSLDFPNQLHKKLVPFVKEHQLKSDVVALFDGAYNDWIDKVNPDWDGAIPVTLIYNSNERQFIGEQFHDYEDLESSLKEVLNKQS